MLFVQRHNNKSQSSDTIQDLLSFLEQSRDNQSLLLTDYLNKLDAVKPIFVSFQSQRVPFSQHSSKCSSISKLWSFTQVFCPVTGSLELTLLDNPFEIKNVEIVKKRNHLLWQSDSQWLDKAIGEKEVIRLKKYFALRLFAEEVRKIHSSLDSDENKRERVQQLSESLALTETINKHAHRHWWQRLGSLIKQAWKGCDQKIGQNQWNTATMNGLRFKLPSRG